MAGSKEDKDNRMTGSTVDKDKRIKRNTKTRLRG
jgi:hypothetical protein